MKPIRYLGGLAAALAFGIAMAAQWSVPIDDPLRVEFSATAPGLTETVMAERIRTAGAGKGWRVESEAPGRMTLRTIVGGKHMVWVDVTYTTSGYTFRYVDSAQMRYRPDTKVIHPNYNLWIRQLAETINAALGATAMVSVGTMLPSLVTAPAAGVVTATAAPVPAAQGMPAPGTKWKYGYRDHQYPRGETFYTVEVAGVEERRVRERLAVEHGPTSEAVINAAEPAFVNRQLGSSTAFIELAPYSPDMRASAQQPAGYPGPAGVTWKMSAPLFREEEVRVPAGTLKALRVELSGTVEAFGAPINAPTRFVYVAWYSPDLNRLVKIHHQTWSRQNIKLGDEHVDLIAYQPAK